MVTSEKGLTELTKSGLINMFKSLVVIWTKENINLYSYKNTLNGQRLALYLEQLFYRQDGGRIADQANASSNVDDSGNYTFSRIRCHGLLISKQLNSVLLKSIYNNLTRRNLSYYTREKSKSFRKDKKFHKIMWPKKWQSIEEKVRKGQMQLCILAEKYKGTDRKEVLSYQRKLALSLNFRLLAVKIVTNNKGKNTPGVDGILINNNEEKCQMVEDLKWYILKPSKYKASPVKRVYIPKANNKTRALGIPNMKDRCLQALLNLVLEPLVEMNSDKHSYGFRKFRSAKMAIGALRVNLRSNPDHYDKYALDADIKGFFDNISHDWLLKHIPLEITLKIILGKWLKAGVIYLDKLEPTFMGTPQGGIISPCLANFTLNGLEDHIRLAVYKKYNAWRDRNADRFTVKFIKNKRSKQKLLSLQLITVRYADDFLVLGRSLRMIKITVVPAVEEFLKERGLSLSKEKTKILSVRKSDKILFLGYCFQYQKKFSPKYNQFNNNINREGISCSPQKENYIKKVKEIRDIFRKSLNDSAYTLITKLNPIIRGWANYFNMSQSYYLRNRMNYALYRYVWLWARRKHPRWGKKRIALHYFILPNKLRKGWRKSENNYYTGNHKKWIFRGFTKNPSIYNEYKGGKYIELIDPTIVIETISARRYRIPKDLETVHAYHPLYSKLIDFNQKMAIESVKNTKTLKLKLFKKQKGRCAMCKEYLMVKGNMISLDGEWHIHHITERSKGGSKSKKVNMQLVHSLCHISHHKEK
jgi:RNA-directed DNA polymerase